MSDTPRTDVAEHNMGSVLEPHYVVDADFSRYLERELVTARAELAEVKEQLRLCNIDQFTTAAELEASLAEQTVKESLTVSKLAVKESLTTQRRKKNG